MGSCLVKRGQKGRKGRKGQKGRKGRKGQKGRKGRKGLLYSSFLSLPVDIRENVAAIVRNEVSFRRHGLRLL